MNRSCVYLPAIASVIVAAWMATGQATQAPIEELSKKAQSGDADAQLQLGRSYEEGRGVAQDDASAVSWYRKAAEQGNARAQNLLGVMYGTGHGVRQDKAEAFRWYAKAARQGLAEADYNMAISYFNGDTGQTDPDLARAWMLLAKKNGDPNADQAIQRIAAEFPTSEAKSELIIADMYEKGVDLPKDLNTALEIYTRIGQMEGKRAVYYAKDAQYKLCRLYVEGKEMPQNYAEAKPWCQEAARNGETFAYVIVGRMAEYGLGEEKNLKEAEAAYRSAADWGLRDGELQLGKLKMQSALHNDQKEAYFWLCVAMFHRVKEAEARIKEAAANLTEKEISTQKKKALEWARTHP